MFSISIIRENMARTLITVNVKQAEKEILRWIWRESKVK